MNTVPVVRVMHVIAPQRYPAVGGSDRLVAELAALQLEDRRVDPSVAVMWEPKFRDELEAAGIRTIYSSKTYAKRTFDMVTDFVVGKEVDIIHAHGYTADYFATLWWITRHTDHRPAIIFTAHGFVRSDPRNQIRTTANLLCYRSAATAVIVCASRQADVVRRWARCPVHEIPHGIVRREASRTRRNDRLSHGLPDDVPVIIFVGRLSAEKDPMMFISTVDEMRRTLPDLRALIIGDGPLRDKVGKACQSRSTFLQWRQRLDDVHLLLSSCDLLLNTSKEEATPRVVLEALALGVRVVAPSIGDVPRILKGGLLGSIVPERSIEAFARASLAALRLPVPDGRRWIEENYSLPIVHEAVLDVYHTVVNLRVARR